MPLNSKELVDLIDAVTKRNNTDGDKAKAKSAAKAGTDKEKKATTSSSGVKSKDNKADKKEEKPYKPKPKLQVRKPAKPKDNTLLDNTKPDNKTKSQARKCLANIERCVRGDSRVKQEVGQGKPGEADGPPPVVVPKDGYDKKSESHHDRSLNYKLGYRKPLVSGMGLKGGLNRPSQYRDLPTPGSRRNISKTGTPQEFVRKIRSLLMSVLRPHTVGHYRVDIESTEGMVFVEVQFTDPQELQNQRLEMQVKQAANRTFSQQARTNDIDVEFNRTRGWVLNGITISIENAGVPEFTHTIDSGNMGRTQG